MYLNVWARVCAIAALTTIALAYISEHLYADSEDRAPPPQAVIVFPEERALVVLPGWAVPSRIMRIECFQSKIKIVAFHPKKEEIIKFVSPRIFNTIVRAAEEPKQIRVMRFLSSDIPVGDIIKDMSGDYRVISLPPKPPMGNTAHYRKEAGWAWSGAEQIKIGEFIFLLDFRSNLAVGVEVSREDRMKAPVEYGVREHSGPWLLQIENELVPIPFRSNYLKIFCKGGVDIYPDIGSRCTRTEWRVWQSRCVARYAEYNGRKYGGRRRYKK